MAHKNTKSAQARLPKHATTTTNSAAARYSAWLWSLLLLFGVVAAVTLFGWQLKKANSVTSAASSAPQGSGPRLMFEETSFDVGKVPLDKTVERAYVYRNVGTQPVVLTEKPTIDVVEGC